MLLFPTIHIKNGKCYSTTTKDTLGRHNIFTSHPDKLACLWEEQGAKWIHVVDVDGATLGQASNEDAVKAILDTVHIPVQFGGGLRTVKDVDHYLNMGVSRVVCGTRPVQDQRFAAEAIGHFGSEKFAVAIDTDNGMAAIEGRGTVCDFNPVTLVRALSEVGVTRVVYTDVSRSAVHGGVDIENIKTMAAMSNMNIIVAGGIYRMKDLESISQLPVEGAIIAAALYEGEINLSEAVKKFQK